jgi:dipicolinate synthase subunit A
LDYKKFTILGGDKRNIHLSKLLAADGHIVNNLGFDSYDQEVIPEAASLNDALENADYVVGPIPCSHNGVDLNAVYSSKTLPMEDMFRLLKPRQIFFAGYIKGAVIETAEKYMVNYVDILKTEELALLNAIPTAEGAIKLAIENSDFTLHDARVMVIGYGRIGKILTKMLAGIGAHVYPVVRKRQDAAQARCFGYHAIMSENMDSHLNRMNIIFNTAPHLLIDRKNIKFIDKSCLVIDLSSPPHGIDYTASKDAGLTVLYTGSLPGIIAPRTTARYIMETIYNAVSEAIGR